ncbi:MAG: helix-turn-helix transcriptional regulator [Iamia sp.]
MGQTGTATATVLFTDLVDSTRHRTSLGEVEADRLLRAHEHQLRAIVASHAGRVLKTAGDGIMAVFDSASDGVASAVALQQGVHAETPDLHIRIGVAAGDVSWEADDCFGLPVVTAARLESAADPGEILVSAVVRLMAGDRAGVTYQSKPPLDLKGLTGPTEAFSVGWMPAAPTTVGWSFPFTLSTAAARPFVGRDDEIATLRRCWSDSRGGGCGFVLIGGDAGAGKTRLATQLALESHGDGAMVLSGVCDSDLSLPYQPWVMALHQLVAQLPDAELDALRPHLSHLAVLVPQIDQLVAGLTRPEPADPEAERHRVFTAIGAVLTAGAALAPIALVLDDLHWAGHQTLAVLRYLARTEPVPGLLVVGTFRDGGDEVGDALAEALADLRRVEWVTRVRLLGLTPEAVLEFMSGRADDLHGDLARLAATVTERTGGNPFFVAELCDHLARSQGDGEGVPESIMETVAVRLQRLSAEAQKLAQLIAVAATRVELAVVTDASGQPMPLVASALDELLRTGLVEELAGPLPTYQYAHALLRDAVVESLPGLLRSTLHLEVAVALERVHEADRRLVLAGLTRHFAAAASVGGRDKAVYYGRRAAAQARRTSAYDEAISLLRVALVIVSDGSAERAALLVDLVDLLQRSGRLLDATAAAREAYETASLAGDLALRAEAAMSFEKSAHLAHIPIDDRASVPAMLVEVLGDLTQGDPSLRARLLASLARAKALVGDPDAPALARRAVAAARLVDEPEAISLALEVGTIAAIDPEEKIELSIELEQITAKTGNAWRSMWATGSRVAGCLELGLLDEARQVLARHEVTAETLQFPLFRFQSHILSAALALAEGRFEEAEAAVEVAAELELADDDLPQSGVYGLLMFMIRREQGRLDEMRPVLRMLSQDNDNAGVWGPGLALAYAELDMTDDANAAFDRLARDRFASITRDRLWPVALSFLAETAMLLSRVDEAGTLYEELSSFAGRTLMAGYTVSAGPTDRLRAGLAQLDHRPADADAHIADALALAERSGSPVWASHVEATWAWILAQRNEGDGSAESHIERARALASASGTADIVDRLLPSNGSADPVVTLPDGLSTREAQVLVLVAAGRSNRAIAEELFISPNTAANHVRSILQKTASANRTEAAAYAVRHDLCAPS